MLMFVLEVTMGFIYASFLEMRWTSQRSVSVNAHGLFWKGCGF